jgi:hypothetical protein
MKHKTNLIRLSIACTVISAAMPAFANDPYLPSPGKNSVSLSFSNQKTDQIKAGAMTAQLPTDIKQDNIKFNYAYGISDAFALDIELGYAKSKFIVIPGLAPDGGLSGVTDSRVGLRYRAFDDLADDPITLTFGAAAIIKGSYKTGSLPAIGDGANGIELSVSLAKQLTSNFSVFATLGQRDRASPVPTETFYKIGANFNPSLTIGLFVTHEDVKSNGNLDIGGPGFSPSRFPEVKEEYGFTAAGINVQIIPNVLVGLQFGQKQAKRNTAESKIIGASISTSF